MSARIKAGLVLSVAACLLTGYGLGSGWIRLGPPDRGSGKGATSQPEVPVGLAVAPHPELQRVPLLDGQVIRVQGTTSGSAASGSATAAVPAATRIVQIQEPDPDVAGSTTLYITRDFSQPVLLRQAVFSVVLDTADPNASVTVGGVSGIRDTTNTTQFNFGGAAGAPVPPPGRQTAVLTTSASPPPTVNARVEVFVPTGHIIQPTINGASNNIDIPPPNLDTNSTVTVFDRYLRLLGQDAPANSGELIFYGYVQDGSSNNYVLLTSMPIKADTQIAAETKTWDSTLTLPPDLPIPTASRLFAVSKSLNDQRFSSKLVVQRSAMAFVLGNTPTIDKIWTPTSTLASSTEFPLVQDSTGSRYYVNTRTMIFHGLGAKKDTIVLVYAAGQKDPIAKSTLVSADGPWYTNPSIVLADNTTYTVQATMSQGDEPRQLSPPITFLVSTQGPTIESAKFDPPGPELGVQRLQVHFKGNTLDATAAKTGSFYNLQASGGTGVFTNSPTIPVSATPIYSAQTNTVTLQYQSLKPDSYQLTVININGTTPGLKDLYNNPVGDPTSMIVSKAPDEGGETVDGIPKPEKAPNAVFPEFNKPRPATNGFNASDHVDTRVCRLYYYRDARRVAEIINRDLKSYNQAAVDTRRRLAEKARTSADTLTDQRRLQEVKAVRAAQGSREAQRQLDQAQAALQQNQTTLGNATQSLNMLQSKQSLLQQQLNDASAAANPPATGTAAAIPPVTGAAAAIPPATGAVAATPPTTSPSTSVATAAVSSLTTQLNNVNLMITQFQNQASQAQSQMGDQTAAVQTAQANLQSARAQEAQTSDDTVDDQQKEDRARESQFRLEVAAAQEDPNSYVPGNPDSIDPVLQVSISVIGEGLLQLRGPMKGINTIRRMINEMDTPAGQVRIAVHTVQINGEREKRMEKVAARIQYYVDHSRFLTVQSSQLLRNAVVKVASAKAELACAEPAPDKFKDQDAWLASQQLRDRKYQEAFFGSDFINELHDIDAEFLHTGNKLLSLHSMDTTSLASALFLLALAKNDTRLEIIEQFKADLATKLPDAEANYSLAAGRTGKECPRVFPMAQNAQFQSFQGFFDAEVAGTDTLNPLQREFIKLAQILKSRIVTELEYNQRFKERGLIEDRLGDYIKELTAQKDREDKAKKLLAMSQQTVHQQRTKMVNQLNSITSFLGDDNDDVDRFQGEIEQIMRTIANIINENKEQAVFANRLIELNQASALSIPGSPTFPQGTITPDKAPDLLSLLIPSPSVQNATQARENLQRLEVLENLIKNNQQPVKFTAEVDGINKSFIFGTDKEGLVAPDPDPSSATTADDLKKLTTTFQNWFNRGNAIRYLTTQFNLPAKERGFATQASGSLDHLLKDVGSTTPQLSRHQIFEYAQMLVCYQEVIQWIRTRLDRAHGAAQDMAAVLGSDAPTSKLKAFGLWRTLKNLFTYTFQGNYKAEADPVVKQVDGGFQELFLADVAYQNAHELAKSARRPLDAKKLLDSLIDDIEEKYIELLEGTRAHTANIDGYVKAIATALDDDFNTQFYYPAFKEIRQASTFYDVTLGQVETTNILTNNRMFAKVEPQATMEFDLPKRDILINEAMNGALAMTKDFGALVADPNFLALAKLGSGQPTASPAQGFGGGANTVRNVLPGLPRSNDEQSLSQGPAGNLQFGSAMEALIRDPAIYKFETGTGFEIRPVIQPDGQSVVFHLDYMYTTNIREPVRADEKHLGRIKRHFIDTEVQLGNYELREVSRYTVTLKAARTGKGVPLFEDIPGLGILFRPLPSASSSLQQNVILSQATIFPTLFDLMGLRIAPAVADLDTLRERNSEFLVRGRARDVANRVFDYSTSSVDESLQIPPAERRPDLYRTQETIPNVHPDGYRGPGLNLRESPLQEGYDPTRANPPSRYVPSGTPPDLGLPTAPGAPGASYVRPPGRGLDPRTLPASTFISRPPTEPPPLQGPGAVQRPAGNRAVTIPPPRSYAPARLSAARPASVPSATASRMRPAPPNQRAVPQSTGRAPATSPDGTTDSTKPRRGIFSRLRGTDQ